MIKLKKAKSNFANTYTLVCEREAVTKSHASFLEDVGPNGVEAALLVQALLVAGDHVVRLSHLLFSPIFYY